MSEYKNGDSQTVDTKTTETVLVHNTNSDQNDWLINAHITQRGSTMDDRIDVIIALGLQTEIRW